jgi:hypothetical protein
MCTLHQITDSNQFGKRPQRISKRSFRLDLQDIGTTVVASLSASSRAETGTSMRLSKALIRRQRRSVMITPDVRSLDTHSIEIVVCTTTTTTTTIIQSKPSSKPSPLAIIIEYKDLHH